MAERAKNVQEGFENRQINTQESLDQLLLEIQKNEQRKKEQARQGFDSLTFYIFQMLQEAGVKNPQTVSNQIKQAFIEYSNWRTSEAELRELRTKVTFAIYTQTDDLDELITIVEQLFTILR